MAIVAIVAVEVEAVAGMSVREVVATTMAIEVERHLLKDFITVKVAYLDYVLMVSVVEVLRQWNTVIKNAILSVTFYRATLS